MDKLDVNIKELIETRSPLPSGSELLSRIGVWEPLSDVALEAANRTEYVYGGDHFWLIGWKDLWPRLRIKK